MDTPLFFVFLFLHLVGLIVGFGSVLVTDAFGMLWIFKRAHMSFVHKVADVTQRLIWLGWGTMVASGLGLILLKGYVDNLTKIKIFFVLLVGLNGIYLHLIKKSTQHLGDHDRMTALQQFRVTLGSTISQVGWWGAMFIGFIHRHIEHTIAWPQDPWPFIFGVAAVFVLAGSLGEIVLKDK